ncbi:hypothetical protein [Hafnia alvei]|uniref:hypothetical protein n=1 Tax=Hafnia alvei TaxID=569 RepID=UPI0024A850D8
MADRLGESDPRKIAVLPADMLLHWQAYLKMRAEQAVSASALPHHAPSAYPAETDDFAECLRIIGHG